MPQDHALTCVCVHCKLWRTTLNATNWVQGQSVSVHISSNHKSRALLGVDRDEWLSASDPQHGEPSLPIEKLYIGLYFECDSVPATCPHITLAYDLICPCVIGGTYCECVDDVRALVEAFLCTLLFPEYFYSMFLVPYGNGWGYLVQQSLECAFYRYIVLPLDCFLHGPMYDDSFHDSLGLDLIRYSHITPDYELD